MAESTRSTFKSYITQYSRESKKKPAKPTFQSYIVENGDSLENSGTTDLVNSDASEFFEMELAPNLHPGESVIGHADNVLKYTPYSEGKQGMSGKLFVTNFKVAFVTADRSSYELLNSMPGKRQRNKLLDENDIPLTAIDSVYQVTSNSKRKKLTQGMTGSSDTKQLELHCKDFQIHTFDFKFTPKQQKKVFIAAVVCHAFVKKESLLFAYEYGKNLNLSEADHVVDVPTFANIYDWQEEMYRCKAEKTWRVADANVKYELSTCLPQYFVVPIVLLNSDLIRAAPQFNNRRVPTWCFTHINGNSLSRMASLDENTGQPELQKKMLEAIKAAGKQRNSPKIVDLSETCPSCKDVQESFYKLRKLCMSNTIQQFIEQDLNWFSSLGDTKWLQLVAQCLSASQDVTDIVVKGERAVVIQEANGCDFTCLVSSIVQILLDPYYRTQTGFQALIMKEWVRMGHPFQDYLCLLAASDREQTPIFLLFLDCVWQLLQQFPAKFEYTETFLTTLWDTTHMGLFETFLFNSDYQRSGFGKSNSKNIREFKLPPVWKWDMQFKPEDISLFRDPLFVLTGDEELRESLADIKSLALPGQRSQSLRMSDYIRKLNNSYHQNNFKKTVKGPKDFQPNVLTVECSIPMLHLWTLCYLRWQAPAQILSGGTPSQYLQQCHMVEEIIHLHHRIQQLQERKSHHSFRPQSELIFGQTNQATSQNMTDILNATFITSSFPFASGPTMKDQQTLIPFMSTPSAYLRNSSLGVEKFIDE